MAAVAGTLIGIAIFGIILGVFVRDRIRRISNVLFGTNDLLKGIRERELEVSETPKSVSGAESMYGPMVIKDFSELNLQELKAMAEKAITQAFLAIEKKNTAAFSDVPRVQAWIQSEIEDHRSESIQYDELKFHTTVLNRYIKTGGMATLKF
ncbi:MAG: hypothetical protein N2376_13790, partial [Clostridia bacterium]|nr:hypothetical protein [Clostridia bacterium]